MVESSLVITLNLSLTCVHTRYEIAWEPKAKERQQTGLCPQHKH